MWITLEYVALLAVTVPCCFLPDVLILLSFSLLTPRYRSRRNLLRPYARVDLQSAAPQARRGVVPRVRHSIPTDQSRATV